MSRLSTLALVLASACALPVLTVSAARADGCYTCGGSSNDACKDYCRYSGHGHLRRPQGLREARAAR